MDYNNRQFKEFELGSNFYRAESFAQKLEKRHDRKRILWIATLVFWVLFIFVAILITTNSRRFEFYGNRLRVVSYEPRNSITMIDSQGNYLNVLATNLRFGSAGTFTVEYLGETFSYIIQPQTSTRIHWPGASEPNEPISQRRIAEIIFIRQVSEVILNGFIPFGVAVFCIVVGFFMLLLSVTSFLYPYEFWEFEQKFNWSVQGGEPTEFGITAHQIGGVVGVLATFILVIRILTPF